MASLLFVNTRINGIPVMYAVF